MTTKRILIIDDEEHIREVVQLCLEIEAGWNVLSAGSSFEGMVLAEEKQPDAILLDVMMPDVDGLGTLQQLHANPRTEQIPVILLTGNVYLQEQHELAQLGVNAVIAKPFDPLTLATQMAQILGWEL